VSEQSGFLTSKILLLNGPRLCGKTFFVDFLQRWYNIRDCRCKDKLIVLTRELFCLSKKEFDTLYNERDTKETPVPEFTITTQAFKKLMAFLGKDSGERLADKQDRDFIHLSVREALIYVSEIIVKPSFGKAYFGDTRANSLQSKHWYIDDSTGFEEEIYPLLKRLRHEDILLVRVRGRGEFTGDSRGYIREGVVKNTVDVYNTGTEKEYLQKMMDLAEDFYVS